MRFAWSSAQPEEPSGHTSRRPLPLWLQPKSLFFGGILLWTRRLNHPFSSPHPYGMFSLFQRPPIPRASAVFNALSLEAFRHLVPGPPLLELFLGANSTCPEPSFCCPLVTHSRPLLGARSCPRSHDFSGNCFVPGFFFLLDKAFLFIKSITDSPEFLRAAYPSAPFEPHDLFPSAHPLLLPFSQVGRF